MFVDRFRWEVTQGERKGCLITYGRHSKLKYGIAFGFIGKSGEGTQMTILKKLLPFKLQNCSLVFKLYPVQTSPNKDRTSNVPIRENIDFCFRHPFLH